MNITISKLQHIGIPVTNLQVSEAFYKSLGFENVMGTSFEFNGDTGHVAMMQQNDMIIELYEMPANELEAIRNRTNGHIDHIAFDTDDVDACFATMQSAGFRIVEKEPVYLAFWKNGTRFFNILGPDGERLEFNQIL